MKTTIDIADSVLRQARRLAARRHTTLKAIVEQSLRDTLEKERRLSRPSVIRTRTFGGHGLQAGLSWDDWSQVLQLAYEGRGA